MTFFELLIFLSVTAIIGAVIGSVVIGLFAGKFFGGALLGALLGPVLVASGITLYLFISKIRKSRTHKVTGESDEKTE